MTKTQVLKATQPSRKEVALSEQLKRIDDLTFAHSIQYNALSQTMRDLNAQIDRAKAEYLPCLRAQVAATKASHAKLSNAIAAVPGEFLKPRTRQMHGFKVGMRKLEGKTTFADEDKTITLIEKHFPDQFDVLVATSQSVVKDAAAQLPAADLKRIGGEITDSVDEVVIKSATGDVEKLVDALIKEKADA